MGRTSIETSGGFKSVDPGTYVARCYRIVDIGTQHDVYQGEEKIRNQIIVMWELPGETIEIDGQLKPRSTSKFYTNSLHEKANLRRDLEAWRGQAFTEEERKGFDLENILGKPCMITVIQDERGKSKVTSVSGLPKGMECPPQVNQSESFWLDDNFSQTKFDALSDGLKRMVIKSEEYQARLTGAPFVHGEKIEAPDTPDDLPF
jgi:hypothetical protein